MNPKQKNLAEALEKAQLKYLHTLDVMKEGIAIINFEWRYLYSNDAYLNQMQITKDNLIGHTIFDLGLEAESSHFIQSVCQRVMKERTPLEVETHFKFKDGADNWSLIRVAAVPEGIFIQSQDITGKKLAEKREKELREQAEFRLAELKEIIESIPDGILIGNRDGITQCNARALEILGIDSIEDIKGGVGVVAKMFNARDPETGIPITFEENIFARALKGETDEENFLFTNFKTKTDLIIRTAGAPVIVNGKIIGAILIETDITKRIKYEQIIKTSLKEKEILLRELYHRTKNNLQVISSLLSLKAHSHKDPEITIILNDMVNRINTVSKIHEMLHESTDVEQVDLSDYIIQIVNLLTASFIDRTENISILTELEHILVHVDTAISCGLIINELITNSLKYAFPGDRKGEIIIKLSKQDGIIGLIVSDNGIGFKESAHYDGKLGWQIFNIIAENQLNAKADIKTDNGVSICLHFKDDKFDKKRQVN
jgi:PAS domain S-box-containing protein